MELNLCSDLIGKTQHLNTAGPGNQTLRREGALQELQNHMLALAYASYPVTRSLLLTQGASDPGIAASPSAAILCGTWPWPLGIS